VGGDEEGWVEGKHACSIYTHTLKKGTNEVPEKKTRAACDFPSGGTVARKGARLRKQENEENKIGEKSEVGQKWGRVD